MPDSLAELKFEGSYDEYEQLDDLMKSFDQAVELRKNVVYQLQTDLIMGDGTIQSARGNADALEGMLTESEGHMHEAYGSFAEYAEELELDVDQLVQQYEKNRQENMALFRSVYQEETDINADLQNQ